MLRTQEKGKREAPTTEPLHPGAVTPEPLSPEVIPEAIVSLASGNSDVDCIICAYSNSACGCGHAKAGLQGETFHALGSGPKKEDEEDPSKDAAPPGCWQCLTPGGFKYKRRRGLKATVGVKMKTRRGRLKTVSRKHPPALGY